MSMINSLGNSELSNTDSTKKASIIFALTASLGITQAEAGEKQSVEDYYPNKVEAVLKYNSGGVEYEMSPEVQEKALNRVVIGRLLSDYEKGELGIESEEEDTGKSSMNKIKDLGGGEDYYEDCETFNQYPANGF